MPGGLTGGSWTVLIVHALWFLALGHEMLNFWGMRKKMKIHARSPMLAMTSGLTTIAVQFVVMLQEVFAQEGKVLPCSVVLYFNAVAIAFYVMPYLLRGLRVVIISDKVWRSKYSMVLSRRNIRIIIGSIFVAMIAICVFLQEMAPEVYGRNPRAKCFFLGDWWFWGPTCVAAIGVSSKLFIELARVQDRINMSKEISSAAVSWVVTAVPFFLGIFLNYLNVVDTPRQNNFFLSICMLLTDVSTFFLEPRRHKGELPCMCALRRKRKVAVVANEPQVARWKERWYNSKVIMDHPILDAAFEKHVQDYLCSESYDFLKASSSEKIALGGRAKHGKCFRLLDYGLDKYERQVVTCTTEELFDKFRAIVDMYVEAGSELEINIETAMRNNVLQIGEKDDFVASTLEMRTNIFNPCGVEIRKMLDENLLRTFLISTVFFKACQRVSDEEIEPSITISTTAKSKRWSLLAMGGATSDMEEGMSMAQAVLNMERSPTFKKLGDIEKMRSKSRELLSKKFGVELSKG